MISIDLVTGFLGSGKTTFIREYVRHLLTKNEKICILENDYGAINVDMMLLSDLMKDGVGLEMVVGGNDYDCHKRRFKTKLITMAMLGYTRVIVEPSGIFDVDEFFDLLHEEPLCDLYEIHNILAIVDANLEETMSVQAKYMLASQVACAGKMVLSHAQEVDDSRIEKTVSFVNDALQSIQCRRQFSLGKDVCTYDWFTMNEKEFDELDASGYRESGYVKLFSIDESGFESLFFMHVNVKEEDLLARMKSIWQDSSVGNILRIKGFYPEGNSWMEINATKDAIQVKECAQGQELLIVIGEHLNEGKILEYFPSRFSTTNTQ